MDDCISVTCEYYDKSVWNNCSMQEGYMLKCSRYASLKSKKDDGSKVPCSDRVMWRDVMPGELIKHGDRMYIVGEGWKTAEETQSVGDTVGKHWIPIQRAAT